MKITSLKQQVKNLQRVSVFVDESYSFSLSLDQLVKYKIKNSDELTPADVKKYQKISEDGKTKDRALAWLLNRPHSVREFYDYMRRKKADSQLADKLAEEFKTRNYLNDEAYAKWLIDLRSRANKSNRAISAELYKKGIGREMVEQVMDGDQDEAQRLKNIIAKKIKIAKYKNDQPKLIKYLTSQGFSYGLIKQELQAGIEQANF